MLNVLSSYLFIHHFKLVIMESYILVMLIVSNLVSGWLTWKRLTLEFQSVMTAQGLRITCTISQVFDNCAIYSLFIPLVLLSSLPMHPWYLNTLQYAMQLPYTCIHVYHCTQAINQWHKQITKLEMSNCHLSLSVIVTSHGLRAQLVSDSTNATHLHLLTALVLRTPGTNDYL